MLSNQEIKKDLEYIKALLYTHVIPKDNILSVEMVSRKTTLGESTIRAMEGKNGFPRQVPLTESKKGKARKGFRESEIHLWIMNRDKVD